MSTEKNCENYWQEKFEKKFGKDWEKKIEDKFENWGNCDHHPQCKSSSFMGGGFYFLFFIGASVYYIQHATNFWMGVEGVLKALVWPAMLAYKIFTMINM